VALRRARAIVGHAASLPLRTDTAGCRVGEDVGMDAPAPTDRSLPRVIVFDVNETLSDMTPIRERFEDLGVDAHLVAPWFAGLLRDGFVLTITGENPAFADLAAASLRTTLHGLPGAGAHDMEAAVRHVMSGFMDLPLHPDVVPGVRALAGLGIRLVTLSNGSAAVAEGLFERNGISDAFDHVLSVEDAPAWKPAASAYQYALATCGVTAEEAMLVAVHPWDVHGAARAGLRTAYVDRTGAPWPEPLHPAEVTATSVTDLAHRLGNTP